LCADGGETGLSKSEFGRDRLERLHQIEGNHFWFTGRRQLVFGLLRQCPAVFSERILDVGCGTGTNTRALLAQSRRTIALDIRPEGLAQLHHETNVPVVQAEAMMPWSVRTAWDSFPSPASTSG